MIRVTIYHNDEVFNTALWPDRFRHAAEHVAAQLRAVVSSKRKGQSTDRWSVTVEPEADE